MAHVLVIDDDRLVANTIRTILEKNNHTVAVTDGSWSDLDVIDIADFDVLLIDIIMPGTNGLDMIRIVRDRAPDVPILVMSGYAFHGGSSDLDYFQLATELGAAGRVQKPFKPQELVDAVEAACSPQSGGAPKVA